MDITGIEHASITDDNREDFTKHMEKFDSMEAAALDGMGLKKLQGQLYRLPASMDKLPDDAARVELTKLMNGLVGREVATDIEGLAGLNMKLGLAEGAHGNEDLAKAFKEYAVKSCKGKKMAQSDIAFLNEIVSKMAIDAGAKAASAKIAKATETNDALVALPEYGTQEKVDAASEYVRRVVEKQMGLTAAEYEEFGKELATSILSQNTVMAKGLMRVLVPLGKTVKMESGDGDPKPDPKVSEQDKQVAIDLGWA